MLLAARASFKCAPFSEGREDNEHGVIFQKNHQLGRECSLLVLGYVL